MLQKLIDTNPGHAWMQEKFKFELEMASGKTIRVSFDMNCHSYLFDAEKVIDQFGDGILADIEKDYGEYLSIASTIANVLNTRMEDIALEICSHRKAANLILAALSTKDYQDALEGVTLLCNSLKLYNPRAIEVWGTWLLGLIKYIESLNLPGSDEVDWKVIE